MSIPIKPITIFVGEQASGKSTLAKLIYFFKSAPAELVSEVLNQEYAKLSDPFKLVNYRLRRFFVNLFGATRQLEDFHIEYHYPSGYRLTLQKDKRSGNLFIDLGAGRDRLAEAIARYRLRISEIDALGFDATLLREKKRTEEVLHSAVHSLFGLEHTPIFFPASRNMTVVLEDVLKDIYAKLVNSIETRSLREDERLHAQDELLLFHFLKHVDNLTSKFKHAGDFQGLIQDREVISGESLSAQHKARLQTIASLAFQVLKGTYRRDSFGEKIEFGDEGRYVFLQDASSGQQESIRMFQDLFIATLEGGPAFRVFEEPESHLFPKAQKALIEAAACFVGANPGNQLVIPTHSPYILLALDNLIKAGELVAQNPRLDAPIAAKTGISPEMRLLFGQVSAWWLSGGEFKSALNDERQGINPDFVDAVSTDLDNTFDELLTLGYENADM